MGRSFWLALLVSLCMAGFGAGLAHARSLTDNLDDEELPVTVEADSLTHNEAEKSYEAVGNVVVTRGEITFYADRFVWDSDDQVLIAEGNVRVESAGDRLTGERLEMFLDTETGTIEDGTLFLKANRFFVSGKTIQKTGPRTYKVEEGQITTCDPADPDWQVSAQKVNVTFEKYGWAKNAKFKIKGFPVIWAPFMAFPARTQRATGLLRPEFGQSTRKGFIWTQPFFWEAAANWDLTYYNSYMTDRGNQFGLEGRYVWAKDSKATLLATFLDDRRADDGATQNTSDWGYSHDEWDRPNHDRYWIVGKGTWDLNSGWRLRADVDVVSDQDYLREFRSGFIGFDAMDEYFRREFDRDLDDYDQNTRVNRLHANRSWDMFSLNAAATWNDNVVARRWEETDTTLQSLPSLDFGGLRRPLWQQGGNMGLFFDFDTQANYFYRQDYSRGSRADLEGRLSLPVVLGRVCQVEPSLAVRETLWGMDSWNNDPHQTDDRFFSRELFQARVDTFGEVHRIFEAGFWGLDRLRHAVMPRAAYSYIPDVDQAGLPYYDESDRVDRQSMLTVSLTNSLMARRRLAAGGEGDPPAYQYWQLVWWDLGLGYDFFEANEDNPLLWTAPDERRPYTPVRSRLEVSPRSWLTLVARNHWSVYEDAFTYQAYGTRLNSPDGRELYLMYADERGGHESIMVSGRQPLWGPWEIYGLYERDIQANDRVQAEIGGVYKAGCWEVSLGWSDRPGEQQILFSFNLMGLGGLGGGASPFE